MDNEEIIANGLLKIREGILAGSWDTVCEGYCDISGEDLSPPIPKESKLDKIRRLMSEKSQLNIDENESDEVETHIDVFDESMTVKDIKQKLINDYDVSEDVFKKIKKKSDLIDFANDVAREGVVKTKKTEGGMVEFSTPFDPDEAAKNAQMVAKYGLTERVKRNTSHKNMVQQYDATDAELESGKKAFRYRDDIPRRR